MVADSKPGYDRNSGLPFASRSEVIARHGMAATSHPLATQIALDTLKAGAPRSSAFGADQSFEGSGEGVRARGRHMLRFVGDDHDVVLCTAACVERTSNVRNTDIVDSSSDCSEALEMLRFRGELVAPPGPGALAHALALAASYPRASAACALALAFAAVALLLRFRPRPKY